MNAHAWRRTRVASALAMGLAGLVACTSSETTVLDPEHASMDDVGELEIVPPSAEELEVTGALRLEARAFCRHGFEMDHVPFTWTSETPEQASVDANGLVTALSSGWAIIEVASDEVKAHIVLRIDAFGRIVSPQGGQVSYPGGAVSVQAGAGALREATRITIEEAREVPLTGPGSSMLVPGTAFRFGPEGMRFEHPVEIRFRYNAADVGPDMDEARLRVHRLSDATWLPVVESEVDVGGRSVTVRTSTFSVYSVLDYRPLAGAVVVTPWDNLLRVGETVQLDVAILDAAGQPVVAPGEVLWSSSAPEVATVTQTGLVTAVAAGRSTITAASSGAIGEADVTVAGPVGSVSVSPDELWITRGKSATLEAFLLDEQGAPMVQPVDWSSANDAIATVSSSGEVFAHSPGDVTILASSGGKDASALVHITEPPAAIMITPAGGMFAIGVTAGFGARVQDAAGNDLGRPVEWAASETGVLMGPGVVKATRATTFLLTASLEGVSSVVVVTFLAPNDLPGTVEIAPAQVRTNVGESVQLGATVSDRLGNPVPDAVVTWLSGNPAVASVDASGLVTGVAQGSTILLARSGHAAGVAEVVVDRRLPGRPSRLDIWPMAPQLDVGGTVRLSALVYDDAGLLVQDAVVDWTSGNTGVVQVDDTGLLTGVGPGMTTVSAGHGGILTTTTVTVVDPGTGGHDEGLGNNLSWPVVFAEGYGVTGLAVGTDPGLRPTAAEAIVVTEIPFFPSTNVADYFLGGVDYYMQKGTNTWQAEWLDGASSIHSAEVAWGDNLTHHTFSTHSMVRVETVLTSLSDPALLGYNMTHLYGERSTEMQGTDGTTASFPPSILTVAARLKIEKLDNTTFDPIFTLFDGSVAEGLAAEGPGTFGVEVNVAGKVIYGFNLRVRDAPIPSDVEKYGWWRLTFSLDDFADVGNGPVARGVSLDRCGNAPEEGDEPLVYTPILDTATQRTVLDIWIASSSGGGSGGGHGGGGSGGHSTSGGCSGH